MRRRNGPALSGLADHVEMWRNHGEFLQLSETLEHLPVLLGQCKTGHEMPSSEVAETKDGLAVVTLTCVDSGDGSDAMLLRGQRCDIGEQVDCTSRDMVGIRGWDGRC
jgi:hypothetical protein